MNNYKTDYEKFINQKSVSALHTDSIQLDVSQLNPKLYNFQKDIVRWALAKGRAAIFADCGLGKGQPIGSDVLTPNGWVEIQELKVGDSVISSDGKPHKVKGVFPKGEIDTYRFYFSDGVSQVFDKDHLHIVRTNNDRQRGNDWRVMSTTDLLNCGNLRYGKDNKSRNYDIPIVHPVEFAKQDFIISPYILGVLLGDGSLQSNIVFTSADKELLDRVQNELPNDIKIKKKEHSQYDWMLMTGLTGNKRHYYREELFRLGLLNKHSYDKFIPKEYIHSSIEQRIDLLRGIMDTDGYIFENGTCQFYSTSEQLRNDVVELVQSLGGCPTKSEKNTGYRNSDGDYIGCRKCYIATFSLKTTNPFYLSRKAQRWNPNPRDNGRWIDKIEFEKKQRTVCISVDSPDSSYVTENYIVTHNTSMQLEWSNQIVKARGGMVLILAPLAVASQTVSEGIKFGIEVNLCETKADLKPGINITNYEKLDKFEGEEFEGVVLDESSILKSFSGKVRTQIIDTFSQTPFRLACTATPAPNDYMELGNHAEFLGIMNYTEMLAMFFVHDGGQTSKWRLKGHAENVFWQWMGSWAVVMESPHDLGYEIEGYDLPELRIHEIIADGDAPIVENMTLTERRQARKDTLNERCQAAADLVNNSDEQWLVWCDLNAESETLHKMIESSVEVKGSDKNSDKAERMLGFSESKYRSIVTKPSIAGFGMNWQQCHNMIFVGLSDSYEQYYQAVRRCWRFGQEHPVDVYIVISAKEGAVKDNIARKEADSLRMRAAMIEQTKEITKKELKTTCRLSTPYEPNTTMILPMWEEFANECA